jgi:hypothetical protein
MFRSLVATAFAALFGLSATAQQQPAQPFRAESNLIVVPTVVVDKKGASVTGLAQSEFQLFEDGKPVPIETFVPASVPATAAEGSRFIVLVLDNVTTPPEIAFRLRDVAKRFTKKMGPSDSVAAISLRGGKWSGATTRAAADAAIDKLRPSISFSRRLARASARLPRTPFRASKPLHRSRSNSRRCPIDASYSSSSAPPKCSARKNHRRLTTAVRA